MKFLNIAFYQFFQVSGDLVKHRVEIKQLVLSLELRGSVILAAEGINVMVAGTAESIREFQTFLRQFVGKDDLAFKESYSDEKPFNRMVVKVKEQILPANDPAISPAKSTAPYLPPTTLKKWLDENKDIVLLDARNRFEHSIGSFQKAEQAKIDNFRDFEERIAAFPKDWKKKTVVTFCTGGIRCEKAALLMNKHGYENTYQLDGGILNYFKTVGGDHYEGDCFVFDRRVAVNAKLEEVDTVECFVCRHPVTVEEQKLPSYIYEVSCPHCLGTKKYDKF